MTSRRPAKLKTVGAAKGAVVHSLIAPRSGGRVRIALVVYRPGWLPRLGVWTILAAFVLGGCAVKLAPDYDKAIFDGLTKANEDAMKLFASVSSQPFSKRQDSYNAVVGELNAVLVQIKARTAPTPPPLALSFLGGFGGRTAQQDASDAFVPPTADAVNKLINIMTKARDYDRRGLLADQDELNFFKGSFSTQMAQALTYEKALLR